MNTDNKIVGLRKMGIAMGAITALIWKPPTDFKVAVIIGIIAVTGIIAQTWLDKEGK
jgi:hypothetical protein